jgi:hypothetical protein
MFFQLLKQQEPMVLRVIAIGGERNGHCVLDATPPSSMPWVYALDCAEQAYALVCDGSRGSLDLRLQEAAKWLQYRWQFWLDLPVQDKMSIARLGY